jgi:hypothetical protein
MASYRTESVAEHTSALRASDRCDRCGAAAYVEVNVFGTNGRPGGALLFCAHHYRQHETALLPVAVHVHDERSRLVAA